MKILRLVFALALTLFPLAAAAQAPPGYLYDEAKVAPYELPPLLTFPNGEKVTNIADWQRRRAELFELFEQQVYGAVPAEVKPQLSWRRIEGPIEVFGGLGLREQLRLMPLGPRGPAYDILLYRPKSEGPVPCFLGMNFYGNQTVYPDPAIRLARGWVDNNESLGIDQNLATEESRGARASRWPVETILTRGYALCTLYYGDVDPDRDNFEDGVHAYFGTPADNQWGSIAAWAWALSRVQDLLEEHSEINADQVVVMGHSRLGKTALWAGACDQRFAMVISNNSGCGGAALSRRKFGETVERINTSFPHWFCKNFHAYNGREEELPLDQHALMALIAPRPLYVASAAADLWADPRGEFLSGLEVGSVYRLFGNQGLISEQMPEPGGVISGRVSYHLRPGRHDLTLWDWNRFMDVADRALGTEFLPRSAPAVTPRSGDSPNLSD